MRRFRVMVAVLCLLPGLMIAEGRAGEMNLSNEDQSAIESTIREIQQIQGEDRVARQEATFKELLERHNGNPDAQWWAHRIYWRDVAQHTPGGDEAAMARRNAFAAVVAERARALPPDSDTWLRYHAMRLGAVSDAEFLAEAAEWMPRLARKAEWDRRADVYFILLQRNLRLSMSNADAFRKAFADSRSSIERFPEHPAAQYHWFHVLRDSLAQEPLPLPADEMMELCVSPALKWMASSIASGYRMDTSEILIRFATEHGRSDLAGEVVRLVEGTSPDAIWMIAMRAREAQVSGRDKEASALRAQAAVRAADRLNDGTTRRILSEMLFEELKTALAGNRHDDALAAAKLGFVFARSAEEMTRSLEWAGRVVAAMDGMAGAQAFVGLIAEPGEQPKAWREARGVPAWREAVLAALAEETRQANPEAERRRAALLLLAGDWDAALAAAALAYRMPESHPHSQNQTAELVAMALRAVEGSAFAAEGFAEYQANGPQGENSKSGLPPPTARLGAAEGRRATWETLRQMPAASANDSTEFRTAVFQYALWLASEGKLDEALGVMRALYFWAVTPQEFEQAALGVAFTLRALDEHPLRANAWFEFQRQGPDGPDKLSDPLAGVPLTLPDGWAANWKTQAINHADPSGKARLSLLAGDAPAALPLLAEARRNLPFQEAAYKSHLALAVAAFKALRGHPHVGRNYADYLRYGPNGPDGRHGTADDLTDPLTDTTPKPDARPVPAQVF